VWPSLIAALSLALSAAVTLDVPYLPQSEDLCGGAAVAMVFRYWGDQHADVQQFAPLVDARAGGIAADRLTEFVTGRGWKVVRAPGSIDFLNSQLAARTPVIILLEDRPGRYHYVVVVGTAEDVFVVHDPAIGPSRRLPTRDLLAKWQGSNFWSMVILPGERRTEAAGLPDMEKDRLHAENAGGESIVSDCDRQLHGAIEVVRQRGLDAADAAFDEVRQRCPRSAGPFRELAGVRFAQRRWQEAASLASNAVALDSNDVYAWNVLGSSRFMQDDLPGSLEAWNRISKPRIDLVRIEGAERMRYEQMASVVGLSPNTLLTEDAFARAGRRVADMPDWTSSRISYRPAEDGFAVVDVAVAERPAYPRGPVEWASTATRFLIDREADVAIPGTTGQGEVWEMSWRWWNNRPRVAVGFAVPRAGWMPGVWRVEGSWEQQTYADAAADTRIRESRAHGGLSVSDWLTGHFKYELTAGIDSWNGDERTVSAGAGVQRRLFKDRLALFADASAWLPVNGGPSFRAAGFRAQYESAQNPARWLLTATSGVDGVTAGAPLALWPGAGDGHARPVLLRAHPLLDDGVITGPAFGRTLVYGTVEEQRWLERAKLVRFGLAGFADAARPWRGIETEASRAELDIGVGIRIRVPGTSGSFRADFARGVRDGAQAITVAWQR
jgi:predicted double-glycine peptidase